MFCIECGAVLGPTNKFCGSCGAPVCVKRKETTEPNTAQPGPSKSFDVSEKGCVLPNGNPSLHKKREEVQSKLDFLKSKFLESKKKMSSRRLGKVNKSSELEILEVRFLDNKGKRLQRVLNGSSSLFIEVESSSAVPDWMDLVSAKFKTKMSMEAMIFKQHKFIKMEEKTCLEDLKSSSKGKRKHFGFFVQVQASRKKIVNNFITGMTTSANESPEKTTSTKESSEKTTSAKESVKQKSLNIISSDSSEDEFGEPKPKSLDSLPSDSSEDRVEEPKREKKKENLPQTSTPGRKLSKRKPKSLDILPSDSSEEEFEEPKREKKKKNLPQTSTPERKLSKQVHVASDTEDMPTLNFQWKKMKKGACSTASPEQSPIKNDSLLEDLPEILVTDTDEGKCTDDWTNNENKRDDDAVLKEFEEMMQQKRERQLFAESTFIAFPAREEPQIQLWVVYESHGGLAINRPFKVDDTVKSVFSWIIQEVDPEVLPPVFHLECRTPTNCPNSNCPHIYELQNSYKVNVADLPEILYLREGYFEAEETITGFGDVLM